jgi:hypothetical protein
MAAMVRLVDYDGESKGRENQGPRELVPAGSHSKQVGTAFSHWGFRPSEFPCSVYGQTVSLVSLFKGVPPSAVWRLLHLHLDPPSSKWPSKLATWIHHASHSPHNPRAHSNYSH